MKVYILYFTIMPFLAGCFHSTPVLPDKAASLQTYKDVDSNNFSFFINEKYVEKIVAEENSEEHPQLKIPVEILLNKKLKSLNYCINEEGKPFYKITGKQNTVYEEILTNRNDVIGKSGTTRKEIVPFTYFGKCLKCETELSNKEEK